MLPELDLANWRVLAAEEADREYRIRAEYIPWPASCPHCGSISKLVRYGKRVQRFRDLPFHVKPVSIVVQRRRYLCKDCGKTFLEPLPDMDAHHRATNRLVARIRRAARRRSFVSIAAEVGLSEGSIRNIQRDRPKPMSGDRTLEVGVIQHKDPLID